MSYSRLLIISSVAAAAGTAAVIALSDPGQIANVPNVDREDDPVAFKNVLLFISSTFQQFRRLND
jgi:hypothetical protein